MRIDNLQGKPITETGKQIASKTRKINLNYPENLRGQFINIDGATVQFQPIDKGAGGDWSRYFFEINNEVRGFKNSESWNLNLSNAGIVLSTFSGGRVDTIAQEADRQYLVWAFLDANQNWGGIGITRKPYSAFSAISSGNKGSTASLTVTNGFQFTIGARVYVRNEKGTSNLSEYNWGTVVTVANTTITVSMDNVTGVGVNITAATGGTVFQHDNFRPYVVTSLAQTLYSSYYCLIGEIDTIGLNIGFARILEVQTGQQTNPDTAVSIKDFQPIYGYRFDTPITKKVNLFPHRDYLQNNYYLFPIDGKLFKVPFSSTNPLFIDLSTTGLNGIVDTIAFANGRQYLVWAISNTRNNSFATIVATRKPFSTFSAVANGGKGSTTCTLTVTNGFQFTIGARAVVRNTSGVAPLFQYNWGTITSVANTSIVLTMDNVANYGTLINSATGGEVKQWDKFYPWVVSSGSQTLYSPYYSLLGEIYTDNSSGNIHNAYRVDDEYRTGIRRPAVDQTTAVAAATSFTFARDIPLWADKINAQLYSDPQTPSVNTALYNHNASDLIAYVTGPNPAFSGAGVVFNTGCVDLDPYASLQWIKNHSTRGAVYVLDFRIKGGMRL